MPGVEKTFSGGHLRLSGLRIVRVDLAKRVDYRGAGLREMVHHVNEPAAAVGQAFGDNRGQRANEIGRQGIAHLKG